MRCLQNRVFLITGVVFFTAVTTRAALPTLSGLAEQFTSLSERYAGMTNRLADTQTRLANVTNTIWRIVALIEHEKGLRETFHGGRIGQYIIEGEAQTNVNGRITVRQVRVDLYADGSVWTNGGIRVGAALKDPEAARKAAEEAQRRADEIQAAWERANLPPALAAIREAQRQAAKTNEVTIIVEGN